jgi:DNA-binding NarL/FixJ family response regulator
MVNNDFAHRRIAVATARSRLPDVPVVAIADSVDAEDILSAFEGGLRGYIPNSLDFQLLVEGLRFVTAGGTDCRRD